MTPLDPAVLPSGIRARLVRDVNGLDVHMLEAGFERPGRPLVVLLHGFPEIAYSWRKVMPALAAAGLHAIAPELRGYGRTTGWSATYDDDLRPFRLLNCVRDVLGLFAALGRQRRKRSSDTISVPRSRPGARWSDPMCSIRWR